MRLKTGRLFAAAAMLGGRLGGSATPTWRRSARFAESLGLAFQIADDVLDCDGDPQTTGKPLGTDLLDGTVTLPLILAAERDPKVAEVIAAGAGPATCCRRCTGSSARARSGGPGRGGAPRRRSRGGARRAGGDDRDRRRCGRPSARRSSAAPRRNDIRA